MRTVEIPVARTRRRSPLTPFLQCGAITIGLMIAGSLFFVTRYRQMVDIETRAGRLTYLDGIIEKLNDSQAMAAKMAATTGDSTWEVPYHAAEPQLDAALEEALALAPELGKQAVFEARAADAALDAMEDRALTLSHEGNLVAARAVFDASYDTQRRIYSGAMDAAMKAVSQTTDEQISANRQAMLVAMAIGAAALAFLVLLWLRLLRTIQRYITDCRDAEAGLCGAQATLETRVEERTREVAASREQYRFLIENIDAIPFEWDPATLKMKYIAPQVARMLDCGVEVAQDEAWLDKALHEEDRPRFRARIDRFVAGDYPCTVDFRLVTHGKRTITVRMFLGGRVNGTSYGVMLDVTRQVQLEAELRQAQKLESVGRLAAGVAHEINTPIQFISDSMEFVRDSVADAIPVVAKHLAVSQAALSCSSCGAIARDAIAAADNVDLAYLSEHLLPAIARARDGLSRVATIVRSMKVFAHPDHKYKTWIDLNDAIASTLTIAHSEYKYVASLETDYGSLPPVSGYAGELNQVILNLLVNAAHAIGDAVAGTDRKGLITVTTRQEGDDVVVSIGDTGPGIPLGIRDRVFDPFFTTKEVGKGTGQGLSHARAVIVDRHHGTLTFDTTLGVGTTFYVRLPIDGTVHSDPPAMERDRPPAILEVPHSQST